MQLECPNLSEPRLDGFHRFIDMEKVDVAPGRRVGSLYTHLNPMPFECGGEMEMDLADDLRAEGYTVTGGHWRFGCCSAAFRTSLIARAGPWRPSGLNFLPFASL